MASEEPRKAFVACLTINGDEIVLSFGPGDHTCERWQISEDQLRLIVSDAVSWLLDPSR